MLVCARFHGKYLVHSLLKLLAPHELVAHNAWNGLGITLLTAGMTSLHYLSAPRERQVEDIHYTLINCFSSVLTYCLVAIISPSCDL